MEHGTGGKKEDPLNGVFVDDRCVCHPGLDPGSTLKFAYIIIN